MDEVLWAEILKRLPAKSLCRFQSVCKDWKSFISSAFFVNLHRSFTYSATPYYLKPYLHVDLSDPKSKHHTSFDLCRPLGHKLNHSIQRLHCPFQAHEGYTLKRFTFVDVIRGVVCISCFWGSIYPRSSPNFNTVLLWNPSIHKYVALPPLDPARNYGRIGFGYDTSNNDFKVVLIIQIRPLLQLTYRVYSARQGSWSPPVTTSAGTLEEYWSFRTDACFVNGTIHWLVSSYHDYHEQHHLLMFDCESEEWRSIDIPVEPLWLSEAGSTRKVKLLEYVGMVGVLVEHWGPLPIELWVMEEHGYGVSSNSWKKLYKFSRGYGFGWRIKDPSIDHENLAPYNSTNNSLIYKGRYEELMGHHVYEETMSLIDHPEVQSYTKEGIVNVTSYTN